MKVSDLQQLLESLSKFVAAQDGKSLTAEIDLLVGTLGAFHEMDLQTFLQLIVHAKGIDPTTIPGLAGKPKKTATNRGPAKPPVKTANDAAAIQEAVASLQSLYGSAFDPALTYDAIRQRVKEIHDGFDAGGLKEVAKAFGLLTGIGSKKACMDKILAKINDRKGSAERGHAIAEAAAH